MQYSPPHVSVHNWRGQSVSQWDHEKLGLTADDRLQGVGTVGEGQIMVAVGRTYGGTSRIHMYEVQV